MPDNKITRKSIVTPYPPLTEPVPNLPKAIYATAKDEHQITKVSVLSNGLKVASENRYGQFCTVGGKFDNCCRFQVQDTCKHYLYAKENSFVYSVA